MLFISVFSWFMGVCCVLITLIVLVSAPSVSDLLLIVSLSVLFLGTGYLTNRIRKKTREKKESKILRTRIVDTSGRTSTSSAVGRSAVGGFVAGPVGAVVGASTAKQNRETTFLITYQNETKKTKKVPNNSVEYEMYCKFLDA